MPTLFSTSSLSLRPTHRPIGTSIGTATVCNGVDPHMAKLSDLISCTSAIMGVPFPTVQEVSRRLREAGIIQTGKGGRYGGIGMTPSDATSLLTTLLIMRASFASL